MKMAESVLSALSSLVMLLMMLLVTGCQTYWQYSAKVPVAIADSQLPTFVQAMEKIHCLKKDGSWHAWGFCQMNDKSTVWFAWYCGERGMVNVIFDNDTTNLDQKAELSLLIAEISEKIEGSKPSETRLAHWEGFKDLCVEDKIVWLIPVEEKTTLIAFFHDESHLNQTLAAIAEELTKKKILADWQVERIF